MQMPPDMVIFDCDGVVVDSEGATARVLVANLARHGLPLTPEQLADMFLGGTMMGVEARAKELGAKLPSTWLDDTYQEVFDCLAKEVEAIPGIGGVLDALDAATPGCTTLSAHLPHYGMLPRRDATTCSVTIRDSIALATLPRQALRLRPRGVMSRPFH